MGITIHYAGKAKSHEAVDQLIDTLQEISEESGWNYHLVNGTVKGPFKPFWGMGYGYIPPKEEMSKGDVTFYPRMVSSKCNGYFKVYKTKFASEVKEFLEQGIWPSFTIDTYKKGIQITLHPKCETLEFIFDLNTLELASYEVYAHSRGIIYGFNGFSCKTQYAGFEVHRIVCKLVKMASRYIDLLDVHDECGYYDSENIETAKGTFDALGNSIRQFGQTLRDSGMDVTSGDEPQP